MKKITIGNLDVELYDSIEELPMARFHKYNKMLLIDSGIGSDLSDFDAHIEKVRIYCNSDTPELAVPELDNMRQNIYFIQEGLSPKHLAFCVLVKSVNGEPCDDISPEGLQKTLDRFSDISKKDFTAPMEAVKKKIDEELQLYFPKLFDDSLVKEYYSKLIRRTLLTLGDIINGESGDSQKQIDEITAELLTYSKPYIFSGPDNAEIQHDKSFENMCLMISQKLHIDPRNQTVLTFYNSFEYIKEMIKAESGKTGKQK